MDKQRKLRIVWGIICITVIMAVIILPLLFALDIISDKYRALLYIFWVLIFIADFAALVAMIHYFTNPRS